MEDEYVNWDDLDLDYFLGEDNWTDDEVLVSDKSVSSGDSGDETPARKKTTATKENVNPNTKSATTSSKSTATQKSYQCSFCDKIYHSTSGFRGHVTKKHDRPDVKGS